MTVSRTIVFHTDFISPFAYLANSQLPAIAQRRGARIEYVPVDVMHAKLAGGNFAPSTRAMPAKAAFIRRDRLGWAARYGLPMNDPKAFRAPRLNSGLLLAGDRGVAREYADAAFHRVWGLGGDPDDSALLAQVCEVLGWDAREFIEQVESASVRERYAQVQQKAWREGVFGVPMMVVGAEMFWGNDRLDFLEECLAAS
jgi:2-hydroxychromene-2-carboxylate isomerase